MWIWIALCTAASAGVTDDVARGWYLWTTGQDDAALALATELVEAHPDRYDAHRLAIAMEVEQGNGPSVEARYREWWSLKRDEPLRRVALAFAVAQRHGEQGAWCDEVEALLQPLDDGPARYWAALAGRQRELRCLGDTGHSDAELRRIVRDAAKDREDALEDAERNGEPPPELPPVEEALGWGDGVVARLRTAYIKPDLPGDLELLLEREPHRVAEVGVLWTDNVGGPARAPARKVASKALSDALESDDPLRVHGALLAYREAGKDKQAEEAAARLAELDPAADPGLVRSVDDVEDPEIYATIDACMSGYDRDGALSCLAGVEVPESGAVTAYWYGQQRALLDVAKRDDDAYAAARGAYEADPGHTFNARLFAKRALARGEDVSGAADAMDTVVDGWSVEAPDAQRTPVANDLQLRSRLLLLAERPADAVEGQRAALSLDPGPSRHVVLGLALAGADDPDAAALHLAHGLAVAFDDTALITRGREVLAEVAGTWHPGGMPGMVAEAARPLGEEAVGTHPLIGEPLPELAGLPEADAEAEAETDEEAPEALHMVAVWAPWHEESRLALDRLVSISQAYAERGVDAVVLDVGLDEAELPEDFELDSGHGGAEALRALRLVALPSVVLTDGEGVVVDVVLGWDRSSLQLEEALDALLPADDEDE